MGVETKLFDEAELLKLMHAMIKIAGMKIQHMVVACAEFMLDKAFGKQPEVTTTGIRDGML